MEANFKDMSLLKDLEFECVSILGVAFFSCLLV